MDKNNTEALLYRLNWILKYADEGRVESIKEEVESLIDEIDKLDVIVPF